MHGFKRNIAVLAVAAMAATQAPARAQEAAAAKPATLTLSVRAEVRNAPDMATIGAGVVTQSTSAKTAMNENAQRMAAVFDGLKKAGIADADMQTSGVRLQPQYAYEQGKSPRLTGYQARNTVSVKVRKLDGLGSVLDTLVGLGANEISGPSFGIDKPDAALDTARKDAVAQAMARAKLYAEAAGVKIARIASISEAGGGMPPMPMPMRQAAMKADTPIAAGEVTLAVNLDVTFELAP